ncbi:MAG: AI-2E family transporter [Acidobacteriota bacterium]|nr:AI-2E family transporter [Blastocatellia bacterium]MDW8240935.1 AI-2E family transporter [Acidobacteriota bacterium]
MTQKRATLIFLIVLTTIVVYLCYLIARPFLKPILFAIVLAIIFYPIHDRIERLIRRPSAAAAISTLLVVVLIVVPSVLVGMAVTEELRSLYQSLRQRSLEGGGWGPYFTDLIERPLGWIGQYVDVSEFDLRAEILQRLQQVSAFLVALAASVVNNIASVLGHAVITLFTLFFLFREGQRMKRQLAVVLPLDAERTQRLFKGVSDMIMANVYGVLAVAVGQGVLTGLAFLVLGLPSPILWGLVAAVFSLVPLVGSGAVWLPASIILLVSGQWVKGLILLGWGAGIVGLFDNIVRPLVISGRARLHTLMVFFSLLGGVQAFGLLGLFIGPVVVSIAIALIGMLREETRSWPLDWREQVRESSSTGPF